MKLSSLILAFTIGASATACGAANQRWGEEVQLSDGKVIVVERETIVESGGDEWAHNRAGVKPKEYRIHFAAPDGSGRKVEWKSVRKSPQTWPESPLVLDIEAGEPVVYSVVHIGPACEVYLKYRHENGAWKEQPLPDRFEARTTNLLIRSGINMPKFVTLQGKHVSNADAGYRPTLKHVGPDRQVCG